MTAVALSYKLLGHRWTPALSEGESCLLVILCPLTRHWGNAKGPPGPVALPCRRNGSQEEVTIPWWC